MSETEGGYLIMSTITKKPYINRRGGCWIFKSEDEAKEFCKKLSNVEYTMFKKHSDEDIVKWYKNGISKIYLREAEQEDVKIMPIKEKACMRVNADEYNNAGNFFLNRFLQNPTKDTLSALSHSFVYQAALLRKKTEDSKYNSVGYAITSIHNKKGYITFTNL